MKKLFTIFKQLLVIILLYSFVYGQQCQLATICTQGGVTITGNSTLTIENLAPLCQITSPPAPTGQVSVPGYSFTQTTSNCTPPLLWSLVTGSNPLPGGLSLNTSTGAITGTPTTQGNYMFTDQVVDNLGHTGTQTVSIAINPAPPPCTVTITPFVPLNIPVNGTQQFNANVMNCTPSTVTWSVNGTIGGSATYGFISNTGMYGAPSSVPSPATFNVTATSVANPSVSSSVMVTITTTSSNTAEDKYCGLGDVSLIAGTFDPPTLNFAGQLNTCIYTELNGTPSNGTVHGGVTDQTSFLAAWNAAACGDIIEIVAGSVISTSAGGHITLPTKSCDSAHWILVRTSAYASLPPEGTLVTPCYANVTQVQGYPANTCPVGTPAKLMATFTDVPNSTQTFYDEDIAYSSNTSNIRWLGIEFTRAAGVLGVSDPGYCNGAPATCSPVIKLIDNSAGGIHHIIYDRCWFHGTFNDETRRAMNFDSTNFIAVINSYFTDFHCLAVTGSCTDAQAISGGINTNNLQNDHAWKVWGSFLSAAAEEFEGGGGVAVITPKDIEFRNNQFYKPQAWDQSSPLYDGGHTGKDSAKHPWIVKNHWEVKNADTALVEGNTMYYVWGGFSQIGASILVTPKNQQNGTQNQCPTCYTKNITVRYNDIEYYNQCFQTGNSPNGNGAFPLSGSNYSFHDNVCGAEGWVGANFTPTDLGILGNTTPGAPSSDYLNSIYVGHNTYVVAATTASGTWPNDAQSVDGPIGPVQFAGVIQDNIIAAGQFGMTTAFSGSNRCAFGNSSTFLKQWQSCWIQTSPTLWDNNCIVGGHSNVSWVWPGTNNTFPTSYSNLAFNNYNGGLPGGDYTLSNTSPCKGKAHDGSDPGANITNVNSYTQGVTVLQ